MLKGRLNEDEPKRKFLSQSRNFPIEALYLRDDDIPQVVALPQALTSTKNRVGIDAGPVFYYGDCDYSAVTVTLTSAKTPL